MNAIEVLEVIEILVLSNTQTQSHLDGQGIDILKICSVKSIYTSLGPLIVTIERYKVNYIKVMCVFFLLDRELLEPSLEVLFNEDDGRGK